MTTTENDQKSPNTVITSHVEPYTPTWWLMLIAVAGRPVRVVCPVGWHLYRRILPYGFYPGLILLSLFGLTSVGVLPHTPIKQTLRLLSLDAYGVDGFLLACGIIVGMYVAAVGLYFPIDKKGYSGDRTPSNPEEWERLFRTAILAVLPSTYFVFSVYGVPTSAVDFLPIELSSFTLVCVLFFTGLLLWITWLRHRYCRQVDGRTIPHSAYEAEVGGLFFIIPGFIIYTILIHFGWGQFIGFSSELVYATFFVHIGWSVLVARRLRWTLYTDYYGYPLSPNVRTWNALARIPFVFAVLVAFFGVKLITSEVVVFGTELTDIVIACSFAPLAASVGYMGWRLYVSGDMKTPPSGKLTSPGRKTHTKQLEEQNEHFKRLRELREATVALNEFLDAQPYEFTLLPVIGEVRDPKSLKDVRDVLNLVDMEVRGRVTGDDFNHYVKLKQKLDRQIKQW